MRELAMSARIVPWSARGRPNATRPFREAQQAHTVVNAPGPEPVLGDLEAASQAEDYVITRDADLLEHELGVAMRRAVEAEDVEGAPDLDTGGIHRDQHQGMPPVPGRLGVASAEHQGNLAPRVGRAGDPPFPSGDHQRVADTGDRGANVGCVRAGDLRLGHREAASYLAFEKRAEPARLLSRGPEAGEDLHVAGVGRGAVEGLGCHRRASHRFAEGRVLERGEPRAQFGIGQKQVPKAGGPRLGLELFHDRRGPPALLGDLGVPPRFVRIDVLIQEGDETLVQLSRPGRRVEPGQHLVGQRER
jgi:hypothetical protein